MVTPEYCRYAEDGTQQGAALMGLPAGRNTSSMPARVLGSAANPVGTEASSIDEQEEDLDRELKVLGQGEFGGKGVVVVI